MQETVYSYIYTVTPMQVRLVLLSPRGRCSLLRRDLFVYDSLMIRTKARLDCRRHFGRTHLEDSSTATAFVEREPLRRRGACGQIQRQAGDH